MQRAREQDRAYFAAHPHALSYTRRPVPGECAALKEGQVVKRVVVARVRQGVTLRAAVFNAASVAHIRAELEEQARDLSSVFPSPLRTP